MIRCSFFVPLSLSHRDMCQLPNIATIDSSRYLRPDLLQGHLILQRYLVLLAWNCLEITLPLEHGWPRHKATHTSLPAQQNPFEAHRSNAFEDKLYPFFSCMDYNL